jgi:hypothetical protein
MYNHKKRRNEVNSLNFVDKRRLSIKDSFILEESNDGRSDV